MLKTTTMNHEQTENLNKAIQWAEAQKEETTVCIRVIKEREDFNTFLVMHDGLTIGFNTFEELETKIQEEKAKQRERHIAELERLTKLLESGQ